MAATIGAVSWQATRVGAVAVVLGVGAILIASVQGMALVPDGSILDGYDVGLLPWMSVGTWLVPIGGLVVTAGAVLTIWTGGSAVARAASVVALLVVLFWGLIVAIGMAPHSAVPDVPPSPSDLATVVYSSPATTIALLLMPSAVVLLLAAAVRRRVA